MSIFLTAVVSVQVPAQSIRFKCATFTINEAVYPFHLQSGANRSGADSKYCILARSPVEDSKFCGSWRDGVGQVRVQMGQADHQEALVK